MKRIVSALFSIVLISSMIVPGHSALGQSITSDSDAHKKAIALMEKMSPQEKVGQLFMVSFKGIDASSTSQIHDLIVNKHIGGVVLDSANDNFLGPENTLESAQNMINDLQSAALAEGTTVESGEGNNNPIPLFVGISQDGDSSPTDQILNGMTPLADEMAIGATWDTDNAELTGQILGKELRAIGINLLLGPSLDVVDSARVENTEDLGVRSFGGDPYWVGEMGQAYIKGVHEGSSNRVGVISKNFPGRGSADRPAENEVATVRKSLEQLKQIELAPFFTVTQSGNDPSQVTDGLLVSHIRYQGFQGNIRATTKPISLDSTALDLILSLSPLAEWRTNGGIMVTDNLGTDSIKKFYDPTGTTFDARQVAKTAFLAGNDLLYMGNLVSTGDADNYTTISKTIDLFLQKYQEDQAFAKRVDDSVLRLLTLKFKQYDSFTTESVLSKSSDLSTVGTSFQVTFKIASEAVTLISPSVSDLDSVLPDPPQMTEKIVFISDVIKADQCSLCTMQTVFSADEFHNAVLNLYGPSASEQIQGYRLSSYTFDDLNNLLNQTGDVRELQDDLSSANWIVVSFIDEGQTAIGKQVLSRFLSEKTELIRTKKIIGFAFNAPYYLDATDISKLTAYYGVYGKTEPFIDVAARVLFQELVPSGALPVSVQSVGYDIITATTPDPGQVIQLMVDNGEEATETVGTESVTSTPTEEKIFNVGDTLSIRTGTIVDHNGHAVPDGTIVRFMIDTGSTSGSVETVETSTLNGIARTAYRIPSKGLLGITVQADPALVSQTLQLDITDTGGVLTAIEPTAIPTVVFTPTIESPTPTETITKTVDLHTKGLPTAGDWFLSTLLILGISALLFWLGNMRINLKWGIRWAALGCIGGYLAYLYLVLGLPGSGSLISTGGSAAIALISILGVILGWASSGIWWVILKRKKQQIESV